MYTWALNCYFILGVVCKARVIGASQRRFARQLYVIDNSLKARTRRCDINQPTTRRPAPRLRLFLYPKLYLVYKAVNVAFLLNCSKANLYMRLIKLSILCFYCILSNLTTFNFISITSVLQYDLKLYFLSAVIFRIIL